MSIMSMFRHSWDVPKRLTEAMEENRQAKSDARHAAKKAVVELTAIDMYGESIRARRGK